MSSQRLPFRDVTNANRSNTASRKRKYEKMTSRQKENAAAVWKRRKIEQTKLQKEYVEFIQSIFVKKFKVETKLKRVVQTRGKKRSIRNEYNNHTEKKRKKNKYSAAMIRESMDENNIGHPICPRTLRRHYEALTKEYYLYIQSVKKARCETKQLQEIKRIVADEEQFTEWLNKIKVDMYIEGPVTRSSAPRMESSRMINELADNSEDSNELREIIKKHLEAYIVEKQKEIDTESFESFATKNISRIITKPAGKSTFLTKEQESYLTSLIHLCGYKQIHKLKIRIWAKELANSKKLPGRKWLKNFIQRSELLKFNSSSIIDLRRVLASSKNERKKWFRIHKAILKRVLIKHNKDAAEYIDVDETSFGSKNASDRRKRKKLRMVMSLLSTHINFDLKMPSNSSHLTCVNGITSSGKILSPIFISPSKISNEITGVLNSKGKEVFPDCSPLFMTTQKGSMEKQLMKTTIRHFIDQVEESFSEEEKNKKLIIFTTDAPSVHHGYEWLKYAKERNVVVLFKPHNSTHYSQPCDNENFHGRLKNTYQRVAESLNDRSQSLDMIERLTCILESFDLMKRDENIEYKIKQAFIKCGLPTTDMNLNSYNIDSVLDSIANPVIEQGWDVVSEIEMDKILLDFAKKSIKCEKVLELASTFFKRLQKEREDMGSSFDIVALFGTSEQHLKREKLRSDRAEAKSLDKEDSAINKRKTLAENIVKKYDRVSTIKLKLEEIKLKQNIVDEQITEISNKLETRARNAQERQDHKSLETKLRELETSKQKLLQTYDNKVNSKNSGLGNEQRILHKHIKRFRSKKNLVISEALVEQVLTEAKALVSDSPQNVIESEEVSSEGIWHSSEASLDSIDSIINFCYNVSNKLEHGKSPNKKRLRSIIPSYDQAKLKQILKVRHTRKLNKLRTSSDQKMMDAGLKGWLWRFVEDNACAVANQIIGMDGFIPSEEFNKLDHSKDFTTQLFNMEDDPEEIFKPLTEENCCNVKGAYICLDKSLKLVIRSGKACGSNADMVSRHRQHEEDRKKNESKMHSKFYMDYGSDEKWDNVKFYSVLGFIDVNPNFPKGDAFASNYFFHSSTIEGLKKQKWYRKKLGCFEQEYIDNCQHQMISYLWEYVLELLIGEEYCVSLGIGFEPVLGIHCKRKSGYNIYEGL
jgi:hypothetical protein